MLWKPVREGRRGRGPEVLRVVRGLGAFAQGIRDGGSAHGTCDGPGAQVAAGPMVGNEAVESGREAVRGPPTRKRGSGKRSRTVDAKAKGRLWIRRETETESGGTKVEYF